MAEGWTSNTSESAEPDEVEAHGIQSNSNETAQDDAEAHGWGANTSEDAEADD
jgi:hypothetical protein